MNFLLSLGRQNNDENEAPDTPNINKLKTFLERFKQDPNTKSSFIQRLRSTVLCEWTKKVNEHLPSAIDTAAATGDDILPTKQHFSTIKQFYDGVQQAGYTQIPAPV